MIKNNIKMTVLNVKFILCILAISIFTIAIYFYQEKNDKLNGEWYYSYLEGALADGNFEEYIASQREQLFEEGKYETDGIHNDLIVLKNVESYFSQCVNYDSIKRETCNNALYTSQYEVATDRQRIIASEMYNKYSTMKNPDIIVGNYIGYEHFFKVGVIDFVIVVIIMLVVYFGVIVERERGLGLLVFTTKHGGRKYYFSKLFATIFVSGIFAVVLYVIKAMICFGKYGIGDINASIQSINGYSSSPYNITIFQFLMIYVACKLLYIIMLSALFLYVSSLGISEVKAVIIVTVLLGLGAILNIFIDSSSAFSYIKDSSLLSLMDTGYVVSSYRVYAIETILGWSLVFKGFELYLFVSVLVIAIMTSLGIMHFCRGLHKSGKHRWTGVTICKYRMKMLGNEMQLVWGERKIGLVVIALIGLVSLLVLNFDKNYNQDYLYEKSMVTLLNSKSQNEAKEYIINKQQELDKLEQEKNAALGDLLSGTISQEAYENIQFRINSQLTYKHIVDQLCEQAHEIEKRATDTKADIKYEITRLSEELVGEKGKSQREILSLAVGFFISFILMSVFPLEKNNDIPQLFASMSNAGRSLKMRVISLGFGAFFITFVLNALWLMSILMRNGIWNNKYLTISSQSMSYYSSYGIDCALGFSLWVDVLGQAIKWFVIAGFLILLSMLFSKAIWSQLFGVVILVIPLLLAILDMHWIERLPFFRFLSFGGQSIFNISGLLVIIAFIALFIAIVDWRVRRWIEA